jgi:hypothetical protein
MLWDIVTFVILGWLICGMVASIWNLYIVRVRKEIIKDLNKARGRFFEKDRPVIINFNGNEYVGYDADWARNFQRKYEDPNADFFTESQTNYIIAIALILLGLIAIEIIYCEQRRLYNLNKAYEQLMDIEDKILLADFRKSQA